MINRAQRQNQIFACAVPKQNVEVLARAMHALARIGEELFVEPVESGLVFRTVHANHSVYAEALFKENFFSFFQNTETGASPGDDEDELNCRISMKSCLLPFHALSWLKRQVETCLLTIETKCLTVKFRCNHGLVRTHKLPVIECESLQAFYTEDEAPNILVVEPKTFGSVIKNFQSSERDITLAVDPNKAVLQNFAVNSSDPKAIVRSQLKMEKAEFESYKVQEETAITFSLKAFRAALYFSDPAEYPLTIKFSSAGSPVIVVNTSPLYELRFILSSLVPDDCDVSRTHSQQMLTPLRSVGSNKTASRKKQGISNLPRSDSSSFSCSSANISPQTSSRLAEPNSSSVKQSSNTPQSSRQFERTEGALQKPTSQTSQSSVASTTGACVGSAQVSDQPARPEPSDKPVPSGLRWQIEDNSMAIPDSDDEGHGENGEDDVLPGTPPLPQAKRSRRYFQRCYEPTLNCINLPDNTVLAEDSD